VWEDGQFSWTQDGKSDAITDQIAWMDALTTAWLVYNTQDRQFDPTDGATMFHATYVKPKWRKEYDQTSRIDNHVFYKNFVKPS
jgi:spore germination cell wall hydrolase CwlJ-like protein